MTTNGWGNRVVFFLFLTLLVSFSSSGQSPHGGSPVRGGSVASSSSVSGDTDPVRSYGHLPLAFDPNIGQTDPQVQFLAHGVGYGLFLTGKEAVLALQDSKTIHPRRRAEFLPPWRKREGLDTPSILRIQLQGSNERALLSGEDELPGRNNYFIGNDPKKWHTGVPTYAKVKDAGAYPGIDVVFYGDQRQLEWDAVVAPGADPKQIAFHIDGPCKVRIDTKGNLHITVGSGEVELKKPVIYQDVANARREIPGKYALLAGHNVRFVVGAYDVSKPLIIDPALDYSTYLGGSDTDEGDSIAVDSNGDAYVSGLTTSTNFPTTSNAIQPTAPGGIALGSGFVTEINPTGTAVLYSTFIGGNTEDEALSIAVDSANPPNVYITGYTCSSNFPTTSNAYQPTFSPPSCASNTGGGSAFVTKFNPSVSGEAALIYSTYLGGSIGQTGFGIAVDATGNIYTTGLSYSTNFPVTQNAFQSTNNGGGTLGNAFVSRIDPSQSGNASLIYSTYLGGTGNQLTPQGDYGYAIAVDASSNVYVTGGTASANFPTTASGFMETAPGAVTNGITTFVTRLNTSASGTESLIYSTYLGGSVDEGGTGISLGPLAWLIHQR